MTITVEDPATKSQERFHCEPDVPLPPKAPRPRYRPRDNKGPKAKVNMRSPSGFFIILGLFIVMVGIAIAVVGYWPHKHNSQMSANREGTNTSELSVETQHARLKLQSQPGLKHEKLKLIGPLIMGFGLFIFICANTVLHENRDRETKLLAQRNIYSLAGQACNGENKEPKQIQHSPTPTSIDANFQYLEQYCATEKACRAKQGQAEIWADCHMSVKQKITAQLLHHKRPSPSISLHSVQSDSCNSSERNLNVPLNCSIDALASASVVLPVIKLNNCIIDTPDITAVMEDVELDQKIVMVSTEDVSHLQNYGYIRSSSIRSADDASQLVDMDYSLPSKSFSTRFIGKLLSPGITRKVYGSDMQLHRTCAYSKSFDLGKDTSQLSKHQVEQKHRSWPRLECSYIKKYLRLENREDCVDRLLEQIEREYATEEQNFQELSTPEE
ncbi:transmembrane protein 200A-like [Rhincodon typus]|uniref:transmembrane protein 200A-like n=1 Tax=Rhincodon typus TaxID=259920 RepID=UPI0009A40756|nr:transmembrane protein 200A-like [Rhincodon typus]XP_048468828.1 transmembrane protein 200A-like [Rhincodon typus]XP_048468829.1 transmembrane protein 200A-like [Rhincodon typus]XP_048468830.1 transmembrane protein 200A-like [Rhincodon typus]